MEQQTRFVEAGGHKTRVLETGTGPNAVVLHGWGGRIESMAPALQCLAGGFHVVALDLPGFGESDPPRGAWGTPDYAAYVRDVLTEVGITTASFVGHSFGAKVALYLSATHPGLVTKLVAVGSPGLRTPPTMAARVKRIASRGARVAGHLGRPGRALRSSIYDRIASQDYRDAGPMRAVLVKVVNEDFSGLLRRVSSPTLLVWGTLDQAVPIAHARHMERLIPDAGLVLFEGAGHFAYLDEPERFCRIVRHFLGAPMS